MQENNIFKCDFFLQDVTKYNSEVYERINYDKSDGALWESNGSITK